MMDEELKGAIEKSVDESVDRAFKKYGKGRRFHFSLRGFVALIVVVAIALGGFMWMKRRDASKTVEPVENHDLTLDNAGILGFTVADFEEPILGAATRQRLLIVEEKEVYVNTTITDTGLFNWSVFNKQQTLTIHGTGEYTVDLTKVTAGDISLNEKTYELTIAIPHAELHNVSFDPAETEVGDTQKGWLAFGDIKLTEEQHKTFESEALEKLNAKLGENSNFDEADRFAKLSAYETYQPLVKSVSPEYSVLISFQ